MEVIANQYFEGERPLFEIHNVLLDHVMIGPGESSIKECSDIKAVDCEFAGKYPFWHVTNFEIDRCIFRPGARAALWYSRNLVMRDTLVEAPKMFREMDNMTLENVTLPDALETLWSCRGVTLRNVRLEHADYLFMHSSDIDIDGYNQQGNYSFQYCRNVVIRNAVIDSRDAFWMTENVTVIDSEVKGEFLGWHSRNLRFINCHLGGIQPLCYCRDLVLENCTMDDDCNLAFEYSTVNADVRGAIHSVKNPRSGRIVADSIGEVILDKNIKEPADCVIETRKEPVPAL